MTGIRASHLSLVASRRAPVDDAAGVTSAAGGAPDGATGTGAVTFAFAVGLAALMAATAFVTGGGVDDASVSSGNTWTEIGLVAIATIAIIVALFLRPAGARRLGWVTGGLMIALFALQAASIAWSVVPGSSWLADGQMLAYLAVFVAAILLAGPLRESWRILLTAFVLWAVTLCAWSLLVKVFPASLSPDNTYGRLVAPFGYWNAIALCAAMGLPCCLWLGARRDGGRRVAALSAPALSLMVAVLVLSYSRSADVAAAVAAVAWLAFVPMRLRALAALAVGALGGAVISVWALTHHGLNGDNLAIGVQDHAGHTFGIVLLVTLVLVTVLGVAVTEAMDRTTLAATTRRRISTGLLVLVLIAVAAAVGGVATSSRGLSGEISYHWHELTNPAATQPSMTASRVFQFGSARPVYWHEALYVGDHALLKGSGELGFSVARLLDPQFTTNVQQAHSYVFETYADLGLLGLAVSAALLLAFLIAAGRTLRCATGWDGLPPAVAAERTAMATLAALVLAFGIQGTLDWTWYFTGVTVPALIAAGWLAGRGALTSAARAVHSRNPLDRPGAAAMSLLVVIAALLGCWMVWRPLHSAQLLNRAENTGSVASARSARSADPYSLYPDQLLASFALADHDRTLAVSELRRSTRLQPRNPQAWAYLAQFLVSQHMYREAIGPLHQVSVLDRTQDTMSSVNNQLIRDVFHHLPRA